MTGEAGVSRDRSWCSRPRSGGVYPIGLERSTRSARMFDTIMQVAGKVWATDACLAGLVRALNDIFHPQSTLCSCGTDKRLTEKQIKTRRGRRMTSPATKLRLKLAAIGITPLPSTITKEVFLPEWTTRDIDEAEILSWDGRRDWPNTSGRLADHPCLDLDIRDEEAVRRGGAARPRRASTAAG